MMSTTAMLFVALSVLTSINGLALDSTSHSHSSTSTLFLAPLDGNIFRYLNRSSPTPLFPSASNTEISQSSQNSLLTSLFNLQNIVAFVIMPTTHVNSRPQFTHNGASAPRVVPSDCVINDGKDDECEKIVKADSPNIHVFCRNSDQSDAKSLKVCTFTYANDETYRGTTSPTVQHKQCVISKAGGQCEKICQGLWSRGFFSTKTNTRYTYSLGKSYDCVFTTKNVTQQRNEKLTCGCAQLATRQNNVNSEGKE